MRSTLLWVVLFILGPGQVGPFNTELKEMTAARGSDSTTGHDDPMWYQPKAA